MIKKFFSIVGHVFVGIVLAALLFLAYLNFPVETPQSPYTLGTTFSLRYAGEIGLDWRTVYTAMIDELGVKKIRLPVYWDSIEKTKGVYDYSELDWQVEQAELAGAEVILAMGKKVPRWPECFLPEWATDFSDDDKEALLVFIEKTMQRYKNSPAVYAWQIENEPYLDFGQCPAFEEEFLDRELTIARQTDDSRPIIVTDSGELGPWVPAAKRADIFGTTMYREVYTEQYGFWEYPVGPRFFQIKRWIIQTFADQENAIVIELQTEPWLAGVTTSFPVEEQLASMDAAQMRENVEFARQGGFTEIYTWGVEWWYWMRENGEDSVWEEAEELFDESL